MQCVSVHYVVLACTFVYSSVFTFPQLRLPFFSLSLMKRVLNFMRNPKLAHILV